MIKDYVYIPLGGNRKGKVRTAINKLIVFFLTGLWHGANSVSEQLGDFEAKAGKADTTIKSGIDSIEDLTEKNAQILNQNVI